MDTNEIKRVYRKINIGIFSLIIILIVFLLIIKVKTAIDLKKSKEVIQTLQIKTQLVSEIENQIKLIKDNNKYLLLTNKQNPLSKDYIPPNLRVVNVPSNKTIYIEEETAKAIELMFEKAKKDNINIMLASGYRSYDYQVNLFGRQVKRLGLEKANDLVAKAGQSEHQTGFVVDISSKSVGYVLEEEFENTEEFNWLMENAPDFGFILRYLKDKTNITGYLYEPWHYRFVKSPEIANYIMNNNLTLEEYLLKF